MHAAGCFRLPAAIVRVRITYIVLAVCGLFSYGIRPVRAHQNPAEEAGFLFFT